MTITRCAPYKKIHYSVTIFEGYEVGSITLNTSCGSCHVVIHYDNGETDILSTFKSQKTSYGERWTRHDDPRLYSRGDRIHVAIDAFYNKVELKRKAIQYSNYDDEVKTRLLKRLEK